MRLQPPLRFPVSDWISFSALPGLRPPELAWRAGEKAISAVLTVAVLLFLLAATTVILTAARPSEGALLDEACEDTPVSPRRRRRTVVSMLVALLATAAAVGLVAGRPERAWAAPRAQAGCRFVQGFAALKATIPATVGECLEDQHSDAVGDVHQQTTRGLLVWRKYDNLAAFTDGSQTWLNGPYGVQVRRNGDRFWWEATPPPCLPTMERWWAAPDGVRARVRNDCGVARRFGLSLVLFDKDGRPVSVTNQTVWSAPAGDHREILLTGTADGAVRARLLRNASLDADFADAVCEPVGTRVCLTTDPWLRGAVRVLQGTADGRWLLRVAAENKVTLRRERLPVGIIGAYRPEARTVSVDTRLDAYSDLERAAVLAHELQHATDHVAQMLPAPTAQECLAREEDAFKRQAAVWRALWGGILPAARNTAQEELNATSDLVIKDPLGFAQVLSRGYGHACPF